MLLPYGLAHERDPEETVLADCHPMHKTCDPQNRQRPLAARERLSLADSAQVWCHWRARYCRHGAKTMVRLEARAARVRKKRSRGHDMRAARATHVARYAKMRIALGGPCLHNGPRHDRFKWDSRNVTAPPHTMGGPQWIILSSQRRRTTAQPHPPHPSQALPAPPPRGNVVRISTHGREARTPYLAIRRQKAMGS